MKKAAAIALSYAVALSPAFSGAQDVANRRAESGGIDRAKAGKHWAFLPPRQASLPVVRHADWPESPIDFFVLAKLEERGLAPSAPADERTIARRLSFDLTGLPPDPEDVEAFVGDATPGAYERFVDRILASPRHGERWSRYWLDVARYADTKGYVYGDREERRFVHSHVYRDWVIRSLNRDLPYDRFLLEQIAADQLPDDAEDGRGHLAAMGFLTLGRRFLGVIHDIIDDRIDTLMRGTQALTVSCARCHDHKFDPIPTRDYYSLYGVFHASSERIVRLGGEPERPEQLAAYEEERKAREAALEGKLRSKRDEVAARLRARAGDYLAAALDVERLPTEEFYAFLGPDDLNPVVARQWQAYLFQTRATFHPVFAAWNALASLGEEAFPSRASSALEEMRPRLNPIVAKALSDSPPKAMRDVARSYGEILAAADARWREALDASSKANTPAPQSLPDPAEEELRQVLFGPGSPASVPEGSINEIEWFFDEPSRVELGKLESKVEALCVESPGAPPHAVILEDRALEKNPRVFLRGNPAKKGDEVPRRFLEALAGPGRKPFEQGSGRLELARSIASRDNPLTARVLVNRVWMHHFGAGIVRTPSDFGTRSDPPSHPELLDWLAVRFMDDGWSIKDLHRLIVLSKTYRQSSAMNETASRADPENRLLWRGPSTRLDFEATRDSLLAVSGELDLRMGGRGADVFSAPFNRRRSVYGLIDRQFLPGTLRVFDFANPDQHTPERHLTTVPQQALFLLNSPFSIEMARALSRRASAASNDDDGRVQALYRFAYQRRATPAQMEAGLRFVAANAPAGPAPEALGPWEKYAQALLLANELVFPD